MLLSQSRLRLLIAGAVFLVVGCAGHRTGEMPATIFLVLEEPLMIPPHQAHTKFQRGRQVQGVNRYDPWCEFEIDEVSGQPQHVDPGRFRVDRIVQAFIKDYNTRMPALLGGLSCDDLVFYETTLWMDRRTSPQIRYLRCFAPYVNCRFGPPLSPQQMQGILNPRLILTTEAAEEDSKPTR